MSNKKAGRYCSQDGINIPVSSFSEESRGREGGHIICVSCKGRQSGVPYIYMCMILILDNIPSWLSSSSSFSSTLFHPKSKSSH